MQLKSGPVKYYNKKSTYKNNKAHKPALRGWGGIDPFGSNVRVNIMLQKGDLRSPKLQKRGFIFLFSISIIIQTNSTCS